MRCVGALCWCDKARRRRSALTLCVDVLCWFSLTRLTATTQRSGAPRHLAPYVARHCCHGCRCSHGAAWPPARA